MTVAEMQKWLAGGVCNLTASACFFIFQLSFDLLLLSNALAGLDGPLGAPRLGTEFISRLAAFALLLHPGCCCCLCSAGGAADGSRAGRGGTGLTWVRLGGVAWQGVVVLHQTQQQLLNRVHTRLLGLLQYYHVPEKMSQNNAPQASLGVHYSATGSQAAPGCFSTVVRCYVVHQWRSHQHAAKSHRQSRQCPAGCMSAPTCTCKQLSQRKAESLSRWAGSTRHAPLSNSKQIRRKKKKNFASFSQPTRLMTHPGPRDVVIQNLPFFCNDVGGTGLPSGLEPNDHTLALLQRCPAHAHQAWNLHTTIMSHHNHHVPSCIMLHNILLSHLVRSIFEYQYFDCSIMMCCHV